MLLFKCITILILLFPIEGRVTREVENKKSFEKRLEAYLTRRCSKNATLNELNRSIAHLEKAKSCFKKKFPELTSTDTEKLKEKCLVAVEEITECIRVVLESIKPCLDKEEQYMPNFVAEAYEGFADYFCEHSDMLTSPYIFENGIVECVNRFSKYKETNPKFVCYEFVKFSNSTDSTPITKKELCSDLDKVYNCHEEHYKKYCKNSPKAWEFERGLLNGMRKPCKEK